MRIASLSLLAWLGLGGSFCLLPSAIAPQVAQAYTSRVNLTLERQPNESYDTLVRRAEAVARAAAQRSFDNDILVTQAAIVVIGENLGLSAPILTLEVSRDNWKSRPDARRWSTYYPNSKALLRIEDLVAPTVAPATDTNTQPPATEPTAPSNSPPAAPTNPNPTQPSSGSGQSNGTPPPQGTINNPGATGQQNQTK